MGAHSVDRFRLLFAEYVTKGLDFSPFLFREMPCCITDQGGGIQPATQLKAQRKITAETTQHSPVQFRPVGSHGLVAVCEGKGLFAVELVPGPQFVSIRLHGQDMAGGATYGYAETGSRSSSWTVRS